MGRHLVTLICEITFSTSPLFGLWGSYEFKGVVIRSPTNQHATVDLLISYHVLFFSEFVSVLGINGNLLT